MAQKCWGIDIGTTAVKAVCLKRSKTGVEVVDSVCIPFEKQTEDKIERISQVRNVVEELVVSKKIGSTPVVVSLMGHNALHKVFELPPVQKSKIPELVGFEARQQIPFDLEDVVWDYQVTSKIEPGEQIEISLFAIKRDVVDDFLAIISDFNLNIEALQLNSLAAFNFIAYEKGLEDKATVMVDMGAVNCEFIIVNKGRYYVRKLAVSGNSFTSLLSEKFKISAAEAEELKCSMADSKQAEKLQRILSPKWRDFVGELQRSLGYYKTIWRDLDVDQAYLLGGTAHLAGLDTYLQNNLGFDATSLTDVSAFDFSPTLDQDNFRKKTSEMGVAMGLGLQGLGVSAVKMNLMPPALAQAKALKAKRPIVAVAVVTFIVALMLSYIGSTQKLEKADVLTQKIAASLKKVSAVEKKYNALVAQVDPLKKNIEYLSSMYNGRNMSLDVQNSLLILMKRSDTKFISLRTEQIITQKDSDKKATAKAKKQEAVGFSFGVLSQTKKAAVKKDAEVVDLSAHTLRFTFKGRILTGRTVSEQTTHFADPEKNFGTAFEEPLIDEPIVKNFDIQEVNTQALRKTIVKSLENEGRPSFKKVHLDNMSSETVTFTSARNTTFRIRDKEGVREQKWLTIQTDTSEDYKRFEVTWECSE